MRDFYPIFFSQSLEKKRAWMIQTAQNFWSLLSYVGATFKGEQKFCMILWLTLFVHQFPRFYYPTLCLRMGVLTSLPCWVNSSFNFSKARFCKGSNTSHVAQSGPGLHPVWGPSPFVYSMFHRKTAQSRSPFQRVDYCYVWQ